MGFFTGVQCFLLGVSFWESYGAPEVRSSAILSWNLYRKTPLYGIYCHSGGSTPAAAERILSAGIHVRTSTVPAPRRKLQSSHSPSRARAACARAARSSPKRAPTALRCRSCSASPEHHVGYLVGQDEAQTHSNSDPSIVLQ